jgi:hypothetical protein
VSLHLARPEIEPKSWSNVVGANSNLAAAILRPALIAGRSLMGISSAIARTVRPAMVPLFPTILVCLVLPVANSSNADSEQITSWEMRMATCAASTCAAEEM